MVTLARSAQLAAAVGGLLWLVKAIVITANDGSFDPLESAFFIGGLLVLVVAVVLWAAYIARRLRGLTRVVATIAGVVVLVAATLVVEAIGKALIGGVAPGDNVGLEEEGGILLAAVAWLAVAAGTTRARLAAGSSSPSR